MKSFKRAETLQRPELKEMFEDVYAGDEPWNIVCVAVIYDCACI